MITVLGTICVWVCAWVCMLWWSSWWIAMVHEEAAKRRLPTPPWIDRVAHIARILFAELRPFYLPAFIFWTAGDLPGHHSPIDMIGNAFGVAAYWACRLDDNDDRWKRRRKRITDRIKATVEGLVVVPEPVRT